MIIEAKFILDKPKAESLTYIILKYTCKDGACKYATGMKILPSDWNFDTQRAKENKKINKELEHLFSVTEKYRDKCSALDKYILVDDLKHELKTNNSRNVQNKRTVSMFSQLDKLIKMAEDGSLLTPKKMERYSAGTIVNWKKTKKKLEDFDKEMEFELITIETYNAFVKWCHAKGWALNYTGSLIKDWKRMLSAAYIAKMHGNLIFKHPSFLQLSEESDQVYLDEDEIQMIYKLDLSYRPMWEIIRDRFVINLYNGLRISDMKKLGSKDTIVDGNIVNVNKKTSKKVYIPIHPIVDEIIAKYKGELPKQYHENVVNRYIKSICQKAGLNNPFTVVKTVGGKKQTYVFEKWELVTNHTCRRSLTTNLLKHASTVDVQPVTGMTLKTLEKYNKRSAKENAEMLKENVFFKKKAS